MAGSIRPSAVRRGFTAVGAAVVAWLVWRLISPGAPPAEAMAAVLGWGLGLVPVHVTLRNPHQRAGRRTARRPAQAYEQEQWQRTGGQDGRVRRSHSREQQP
jgi:hypothetical protein